MVTQRAKHPNRVPVTGILTKLDVPSDSAPYGAQGHPLLITLRAAVEALPTLEGQALNFVDTFDTHNRQQKCGVIEHAWIKGSDLHISGYIYGHDFPQVVKKLQDPKVKMGMSYDAILLHVQDKREKVWTITELTFIGAAILLADTASMKTTLISVSAAAEPYTGRVNGVRSRGRLRIER